ncbi:hypothetical protein PDESU_03492 [Pontiella desulfatans]|uniref:HEAT repeat domain-containing protein n=1 Tax=Pontiella desulfatans TaxID=2750659 RepID=A0A6C2U4E8_PONDE|nr:HEAT repeat domain-containing protein [Pontiella desulfatans]VGO14922.1 hypothetical protein PDESU_03492 [Pontiella desulfatans]
MYMKTLLSIVLLATASHAAVQELLPQLASDDLGIQTQARLDLLAVCSNAGKPGNEDERKAVSEEICQVLQNDVPVVAVMEPMIRNLERIGGEEAVPTLAKLLNHKEPHVRDDARRALAVNPSPAAAQALGAQLKMRKARDARETAGLIQALGERKEAGAVKLLVDYLNSNDDLIFIATVKALGRMGSDDAIRVLAEHRSKEKEFRLVQVDAALFSTEHVAVFQKLYSENETEEVRAVALLGLALNNGGNVAASAMASGNPALQSAVIEAALQSGDARLQALVAGQLGPLPPYLQARGLAAIEFSGNRAFAKAVEPLLKSSDTQIQDDASKVLARIGSSDSVSALLSNGRPEALRALGMLDADGVDAVLEKEAASANDQNRRAAAIAALANRGRRDLMPTFFAYAAEEGKEVPKAAVKAIGEIGGMANLEQLSELMVAKETSPVSRDVLNAMVELLRRSSDPAKAIGILVARMEGASPRSQANILQALVQTGSTEALKPVAEACKSSDEALQKQAVKLLGGWKADNAIPVMLELAADESMSVANHVTLMRGASRLLAGQKKLNKKQAEQALATCRRDEEKEMIQAVIDKKKK